MPTPLSPKALLFSALCAASLTSAQAAKVYFLNASGPSGLIDVYMNGVLVFDNIFPEFPMMFPREIAPGTHALVVTPYNVAPGPQNLLATSMEFAQDGFYTLRFAEGKTDFDVPVLKLTLRKHAWDKR